ncbi:PTS sugar transporter subunit IIB [Brachybacterium hainanense]|uniref:PTS sugar transporter subunit IIB n=1 Tax=Brachybacterium hainanense TaxID=1541174 RepID=A0ABV6RD83_9MICO
MIDLVRVDDRLIHGQVAIGWTAAVGANTILVANDAAQADPTQAMALKLAAPSGVKLYIRSVAESGEIVRKFADAQKARVMVLVKTVADAAALIAGSDGAITSLNIGGQRAGEGRTKLTDHTAVTDEELAQLDALQAQGVAIDLRMLPRDTPVPFAQARSRKAS